MMESIIQGEGCIKSFTNERGTIRVDLCKMVLAAGPSQAGRDIVES